MKLNEIKTMMVRIKGVTYDLYNLPDILHVKSDFPIPPHIKGKIRLPRKLRVDGECNWNGLDLEMPDELIVKTNLYLENASIDKFPSKCVIGNSLWMKGAKTPNLPDNLVIGNAADFTKSSITKIPNGIKTGGSLDISFTTISTIPTNIDVGNLYFDGTNVTRIPLNHGSRNHISARRLKKLDLPDGLVVNGFFDLSFTKLDALPDRLKVGEWLGLSQTKLKVLPDNMDIGDSISGFFGKQEQYQYKFGDRKQKKR